MYHHKTFLSHGRKRGGHRKKHKQHFSHFFGHYAGFSKIRRHRQLEEGAAIPWDHGLLKNRKRLFHGSDRDVSAMKYLTGKTASRRDSGLKLSVDLEKCVRCGKCEKFCPTGAIMVDEDIFRVDTSRCNGCGRCIAGCRQGALSLGNEEEVFIH
ncbi:MAG: 4Fe-4S binding protein [Deltaproteobacteria bacterium]|nr:4Fe-4S binding protein [Deltaproteobacteria bacterium]